MQEHQRIHGSSRLPPFDMWNEISENYRILGDLTIGRDGTVIKKAQQIATGDLVTLKVMPVRDEERRVSCRREAELLSCVSHRNILGFYEAFECLTDFVLVTEFCPGGDLLDRVNNGGKIPESEARGYLLQLLGALQYLTERGIAHRDVKLDNVFIGEGGVLKLGDFGFARRFAADERFHTSCGTLVYVAPELLVPAPDYEPVAAEVYSLGVTLFAMCAAYLPYDNLDEKLVVAAVRKGGASLPAFFSADLAQLVRSMIAVAPSARPTLAAVRASEWLAPLADLFQRSYSHPRVREIAHTERRPRSLSVPDSVNDALPPTSAVSVNLAKSPALPELPAVTHAEGEPVAATKSKRHSWLYRKLVQPIASRLSGSGGSKIVVHA